jgi:hypothetical protein
MRWAENLARIGERRGAYRVLVGKPGGKRLLGKPGIDGKIILKWFFGKWDGGMDWIALAPDRDRWRTVVNAVMKLWVPKNAGNFLIS